MFVVVSSLLLLLCVLKICSTERWQGMADLDLITDWQGPHMQANNPKPHLTWQEQRSKMCLQFVSFRCLCYNTKKIAFCALTLFSAMREGLIPVCLESEASPAALQTQRFWFKRGLAVVSQKLAGTRRFSCFRPSRHDCFGFSALTLLSRKRSQRVLSRNSFIDDHKKLMKRSGLMFNSWQIADHQPMTHDHSKSMFNSWLTAAQLFFQLGMTCLSPADGSERPGSGRPWTIALSEAFATTCASPATGWGEEWGW